MYSTNVVKLIDLNGDTCHPGVSCTQILALVLRRPEMFEYYCGPLDDACTAINIEEACCISSLCNG